MPVVPYSAKTFANCELNFFFDGFLSVDLSSLSLVICLLCEENVAVEHICLLYGIKYVSLLFM